MRRDDYRLRLGEEEFKIFREFAALAIADDRGFVGPPVLEGARRGQDRRAIFGPEFTRLEFSFGKRRRDAVGPRLRDLENLRVEEDRPQRKERTRHRAHAPLGGRELAFGEGQSQVVGERQPDAEADFIKDPIGITGDKGALRALGEAKRPRQRDACGELFRGVDDEVPADFSMEFPVFAGGIEEKRPRRMTPQALPGVAGGAVPPEGGRFVQGCGFRDIFGARG